jgi:hypothetical protein
MSLNDTEKPGGGGLGSRQRLMRLSRLSPLLRWSAGVASAALAGVLTAWLLVWGPAPGSGPETHPDALPFTIAAEWTWAPGAGFITDQPIAKVPPRPNGGSDDEAQDRAALEEWNRWVRQGGAVRSTFWGVRFTVQGKSEAEVTLTELKIRIVERRPPLGGTKFGPGGGDPTEFRRLDADLDQVPPKLTSIYDPDPIYGEIPKAENRPIDFPYRVALSDAETFVVRARTEACDCSWVMDLSWTSQGKTGIVTIDDAGQPFRISAETKITRACTWFYGQPEQCRSIA